MDSKGAKATSSGVSSEMALGCGFLGECSSMNEGFDESATFAIATTLLLKQLKVEGKR